MNRLKFLQAFAVLAEEALTKQSDRAAVDALKRRAEWEKIKVEYHELRNDMKKEEVVRYLAEKYHYSEKSVELRIYS